MLLKNEKNNQIVELLGLSDCAYRWPLLIFVVNILKSSVMLGESKPIYWDAMPTTHTFIAISGWKLDDCFNVLLLTTSITYNISNHTTIFMVTSFKSKRGVTCHTYEDQNLLPTDWSEDKPERKVLNLDSVPVSVFYWTSTVSV